VAIIVPGFLVEKNKDGEEKGAPLMGLEVRSLS
jgi:hypothetical protein